MAFAVYETKHYILEVLSMNDTTNCASPLLTEAEVAKLLKVGRRTLAGWRARRVGPPWADLSAGKGRKSCVRYPLADLQAWIEENTKRTA